MTKRKRESVGSVVFDKRSLTWHYIWWEDGRRRSKRIGTKAEFRSKAAAKKAAVPLMAEMQRHDEVAKLSHITVRELVRFYREERMPDQFSTKLGYDSWLNNHILPKWGDYAITGLQARPVELWLSTLALSPKSKVHIRGLLRVLWDYAMFRRDIPTQRNPIELVTIKGATKRSRAPRSLTVQEFQKFRSELEEPARTIALVCVCLGLRISECLALKWSDVDWLNGNLLVERGIVRQRVGRVKTKESQKLISISDEMMRVLKTWKQSTQFSSPEDWIFASPLKLGRLPLSYPWVWKTFQCVAIKAGIGKLGTHTMRHTYRSWLDALGTSVAVQQKLMRHSDVRTTMNVYGDVVTDEMKTANSKIAGLALNGL